MFITKQQHPCIEFSPEEGQQEPTLVHYFSDRCDPFKSVLPILSAAAGQEQEHVLVVESPLAEIVDEVIRIHREPDWPDRTVVDDRHRAFFAAVRRSLEQAIAKIDYIEFAVLDDDE